MTLPVDRYRYYQRVDNSWMIEKLSYGGVWVALIVKDSLEEVKSYLQVFIEDKKNREQAALLREQTEVVVEI